MEARRITDLETRQNALELVVRTRLEEAAAQVKAQLLEQDEQRGALMAAVSVQLKQALAGIDGLREDLRRKETLEGRIAQLTESPASFHCQKGKPRTAPVSPSPRRATTRKGVLPLRSSRTSGTRASEFAATPAILPESGGMASRPASSASIEATGSSKASAETLTKLWANSMRGLITR
jgi:hypothetical protein